MAQREQHSVYLPNSLSEQVEDYKDEHGFNSFSKAAVDLLEASVQDDDPDPGFDSLTVSIATNVLAGAIIVGVAGATTQLVSVQSAALGAGILALLGTLGVAYANNQLPAGGDNS